MGKLVTIVIAVALFAGACSSDKETTLDVTLSEWQVGLSTSSVAAGSVTVRARNAGTTEHELVLVKTTLPADALPTEGDIVKEDAEGLGEVGEIAEFAANSTEEATFNLDAGAYVLFCNVESHYAKGMHASLTAT